ncbi:MAG: phenylalanine--tRNA ligase subunit alpha [Candidatus Thorarchaeota archaeon]|jgi:phenylalanyl-tRNA synthetase alpha chain
MTEQQLTKGERIILEGLIDIGKQVSVSFLSERVQENEERVISILNSLAERGLVELIAHERVFHGLTEEGKDYAINWLPEVRLFGAVQELGGKASIDDAISKSGLNPKTKGIALSWARKNGWLGITKQEGVSFLEATVKQADSSVMQLLQLLLKGEDEPEEQFQEDIDVSIQRGLVTKHVSKDYETRFIYTEADRIKTLLSETSEGVVDLTPDMLTSGTWKDVTFRPFNVSIAPPYVNYGRKHPYAEFNDWLKEILVGLGFTEWFGPFVETELWNNDALFVPQDHVAREVQDQYRVTKPYDHGDILSPKYYREVKAVHENGGNTGSLGWEAPFSKEVSSRLVLRSHTTPVSMRYLSEHKESPQKMFIVDRNFRAENLSARHAQEFNQCEGIIMDKGLHLRDLMGYLSEIVRRVGIKKMKFKPGQFPFTEPSVECFAKHDVLGWIEVAPGGIFRPEVTHPHGIKDPVLAWGIGSGRLYMASLGINDIRELYSRDLAWIRRKYFVR